MQMLRPDRRSRSQEAIELQAPSIYIYIKTT
jgi:hypothetical protein